MTRVEIPVHFPIVHITDEGQVTIHCAYYSTTATITPGRHHREADLHLVRAMYEASRAWMVKMGEIDAPQEDAA